MADNEVPNQISHFIGIACIAAYQERENSHVSTYFPVFGNEYRHVFDQSMKQTRIDIDLGVIATKYGEALINKKTL